MSAVAAAGFAAAAFGAGDFLGGVAARGSDWRYVVSGAIGAGLAVLGVAAGFDSGFTGALPLAWCLSAGAGFAVGVSLLYRALAEGRMMQVAPITAIVAITVPALVDILTGGKITGHLILGLGAASVSTALLTGLGHGWHSTIRDRSLVIVAIGAGFGLALFYVGLDRVDAAGGGIWGAFLVRAISFVAATAFALKGRREAFNPRSFIIALGAGLLDGVGNLLLMFALATGRLAETAAIASLYPVATVLLAIAVLRERPSISQGIGLLMAIPSVLFLKSN